MGFRAAFLRGRCQGIALPFVQVGFAGNGELNCGDQWMKFLDLIRTLCCPTGFHCKAIK